MNWRNKLNKTIYSLFKKGKQNGKLLILERCRSFYYRFYFGRDRRLPLANLLENAVTLWEQRYLKFAETNMQANTWDEQYSSDKWDYLHDLEQVPRYSLLCGYMDYLKSGGAFLDVGCGEGILFNKYKPYGYCSYVGVDVSETAIEKLNDHKDKKTTFVCADAEQYEPSELFDAIIFNESIYYFKEPLKVFKRYSAFLKKDGVIITSVFANPHIASRGIAINRLLNATYSPLIETYCISGKKKWICSVYDSKRKQ